MCRSFLPKDWEKEVNCGKHAEETEYITELLP